MSKKLALTETYAINNAIELTKLAIENNLIAPSDTSQNTADEVFEFTNRLYLQFSGKATDEK